MVGEIGGEAESGGPGGLRAVPVCLDASSGGAGYAHGTALDHNDRYNDRP